MAETIKNSIFGLDGSKYPGRMGKAWREEEVVKLLTLIRNKKTIEEIASEHERTRSGITSRLRKIAADYWFYNKLPIEKIKKITRLSEETIRDAIEKRSAAVIIKETKKALKENDKMPNQLEEYIKSTPSKKSQNTELNDEIQILKKEVQDIKKDTRELLSLIHAIYEFETCEK